MGCRMWPGSAAISSGAEPAGRLGVGKVIRSRSRVTWNQILCGLLFEYNHPSFQVFSEVYSEKMCKVFFNLILRTLLLRCVKDCSLFELSRFSMRSPISHIEADIFETSQRYQPTMRSTSCRLAYDSIISIRRVLAVNTSSLLMINLLRRYLVPDSPFATHRSQNWPHVGGAPHRIARPLPAGQSVTLPCAARARLR